MKKYISIILMLAFMAYSIGFCIPENIVFAKQIEKGSEEGNEYSEDDKSPLVQQNDNISDSDRGEGDDEKEENSKTAEGNENKVSSLEDETESADADKEKSKKEDSAIETIVPIYNYEIDNVVVPTTYAMSLNPYEMPIFVKDDIVSREQVVSRKYGVINKSSTDKVVTITLTVEDLNNKITFVDSEEEAKNADKECFAVYLSVIPASKGTIKIEGTDADIDTHPSALSDVEMKEIKRQSVALHAGENKISFKLSKAIYNFGDMVSVEKEKPNGSPEETLDLISLNPDGKSVTAFTFGGAMNQKADWEKLLKGIKITATYDYETADGTEKIIDGTGTMVVVD